MTKSKQSHTPDKGRKTRRRIPTQEERDGMVAAYQSGNTLKESAALFGFGLQACWAELKRREIPRRSASECKRKYVFAENYFGAIDTEEKAYWLGFVTADGYVCEGKNGPAYLVVVQHVKDHCHLEKMAVALEADCPVLIYTCDSGSGATTYGRLQFTSARLVADLVQLGVRQRKSLTVRPWEGPLTLMPHFWRGVLDGDGSIFRRDNGWTISLAGTIDVVNGFARFVRELTGCHRSPVRGKGRAIYTVTYGRLGVVQAIAGALYDSSTVSLGRKKQQVGELLAAPPRRQDWHWLTLETLQGLKTKHKTWTDVASILGTTPENLASIRKRLVRRQGACSRYRNTWS